MLTKEQKQTVLSIIDRGEWKHSWHMPKDAYGYIDWNSPKTLEACLAIIVSMRNEAAELIKRIEAIDTHLVKELKNINERLREDETNEVYR